MSPLFRRRRRAPAAPAPSAPLQQSQPEPEAGEPEPAAEAEAEADMAGEISLARLDQALKRLREQNPAREDGQGDSEGVGHG
ncbi:MAG: hypothetical protein M0T77_05230 [Actinomycetota bacterium]|nr:hypothetical protein [Actinomycetota bacterium]